jgi:hypothetical protein
MTKQIKVLDALPGCGKTTAILKHMNANQDQPWLYLSPMKQEVEVRLNNDIEQLGLTIQFFVAEDKDTNKERRSMTLQVLDALQRKENIACTHALMLRFTDEHLALLKQHGYRVVCDEELNLISAYNEVTKDDIDWLLENQHIKISEEDGCVILLSDIPDNSKYADVAMYARMGCLYAAKRKQHFLVLQMSPKIIDAASEFILLTYLYKGSIMDTFMSMHGYSSEKFELELLYSERERITQLKQLIEFIETPAVYKAQKHALSANWWRTASREDINALEKNFKAVVKYSKLPTDTVMHTLPKSNHSGRDGQEKTSKVFKPAEFDTSNSFVQSTARATNQYAHKKLAIHMLNIYPNQPILAYMQDMSYLCDSDNHALSTLIQWLFRGCIRRNEPMKVAIFSKRMSTLLKLWLSRVDL